MHYYSVCFPSTRPKHLPALFRSAKSPRTCGRSPQRSRPGAGSPRPPGWRRCSRTAWAPPGVARESLVLNVRNGTPVNHTRRHLQTIEKRASNKYITKPNFSMKCKTKILYEMTLLTSVDGGWEWGLLGWLWTQLWNGSFVQSLLSTRKKMEQGHCYEKRPATRGFGCYFMLFRCSFRQSVGVQRVRIKTVTIWRPKGSLNGFSSWCNSRIGRDITYRYT